MIPNFESFLDATPEKGVIIVEYYWQPPLTALRGKSVKGTRPGQKTSMIFFKRLRTTDKCWCGSKKQFGRCHRRVDDWSYVTLDPDERAFSPVVLLERTFTHGDFNRLRGVLQAERGLLPIEDTSERAIWGVPAEPSIKNEIGQLLVGTVGISRRELHLETNSEKRFDELTQRLETLLGDSIHASQTRRAEPQRAFAPPTRRKKS